MKTPRAMLAVVLAGSMGPAARAEPSNPPVSQEDYDKQFIWFEQFNAIDPKTGTLYEATLAYEGKYRKPLAGADFYRRVGREDLAQQYVSREERRQALMVSGSLIALGSLVATFIIAANGASAAPCDLGPSFAQCVSAHSADARSSVATAAAVGIGGGLIGGALMLAGAGTHPHPVDAAQMRELADAYNQRLKQRVSVVPLSTADKAGLALDVRF